MNKRDKKIPGPWVYGTVIHPLCSLKKKRKLNHHEKIKEIKGDKEQLFFL